MNTIPVTANVNAAMPRVAISMYLTPTSPREHVCLVPNRAYRAASFGQCYDNCPSQPPIPAHVPGLDDDQIGYIEEDVDVLATLGPCAASGFLLAVFRSGAVSLFRPPTDPCDRSHHITAI